MKKEALSRAFVRFDKVSENRTDVVVRVIAWPSPHTPESSWEIWKSLDHEPSGPERESLVSELLEVPRYFGRCAECGKRNPAGWMHTSELCQKCAERNHGVVY